MTSTYSEDDLLLLKRELRHIIGVNLTQNDLAIELDALKARYNGRAPSPIKLPDTDYTPAKPGWVPWSGGLRPVPADRIVEAKLRNGEVRTPRHAGAYLWTWSNDTPGLTYEHDSGHDIIAYRLA